METLEGFPSLPALWLRRAKPGFANAIHRELSDLGLCCVTMDHSIVLRMTLRRPDEKYRSTYRSSLGSSLRRFE
jgi:hypothetical protein